MRRRSLSVVALFLAAACGVADNSSITEPTIQRPLIASPVVVQSCPVTFTQLENQLLALFTDGSSDENSALGKLNNIQHQLEIGSIADAQAKAWDLAGFIQQKKTKNTFLGDDAEIAAFNSALFCFVGYGQNSFLIYPSDLAQTITVDGGLAGVQIPANNVLVPTLLTINPLTSAPPLNTLLDIYPLYYDFAITNETGAGTWLAPVIVGVCASADASVLPNLLLGHQSGTTFELLNPEPVPFLTCSGTGGSGNVVTNLAGDSLTAAAVIGSAGVGGSTDDFSPIVPVDGRVVGSSGAGGSTDDFRPRRGVTPSMNLVSLPSVVCSLPIQAVIGTEVAPECRPLVTFATPLGTELTVPVDWAVETGGGSIANPATSCSPFGQSLTLNTDATTGITTVCWKLGPAVGTNTVTAKGKVGGDAPLGVNFVYTDNGTLQDVTGIRFTATAIKLSTTTTITCPTSVQYNGQAQTPCTAVATDGTGWSTAVTVTHTNNVNAGTANASATFAEDATHYGSGDTETFQITQRPATATAGNGTMLYGGVVPAISCTVAGLVAGDAGAITCTVSVTGTPQVPGVATVPTISYNTATAQNNYAVTPVNGFLTVQGYVQVGCFSSPVFSVMPSTKSAQNKGSNLPVKCTLKWPNGTSVTNATGKLELWNLGTGAVDGTTPQPSGAAGLTINPAFAPTSSGNYSHQLNTNPTFYAAGNAYYIKATWSDGSTTTGYFRIK